MTTYTGSNNVGKQHFSSAKNALLNKYLRRETTHDKLSAKRIQPREPHSAIPLSFGQQQLWLLDQMLSGVPTYTEFATIRIPGPLDIPALEQSLNEIIKRHEAWRTSFSLSDEKGGEPIQVIHPSFPIPFSYHDLSQLPSEQREQEASRLVTTQAQEPFDLQTGPLVRTLLVRLDEQEHRLYFILHHIIFDGVSLYEILLPELHTFYTAFTQLEDTSSLLPPFSLQYADFAAWQHGPHYKQEMDKHLAYWKQQLQGAPSHLDLPIDHARPHIPTYKGTTHSFAFGEKLTERLKMLSQHEGVTLYTTLIASFQTLLYRYTHQADVLTGIVADGRNDAALRNVMGYFLNTLVLRTHMDDSISFHDLLQQVRITMLEAIEHQDVPFEYLVKELHPVRVQGQNPLIQTLITLLPTPPAHPSGWSIRQLDTESSTAKFDLSVALDDRPEGLIGRLEYSTDLFEAATIERMARHWQHLLESIVFDAQQPLAHIPLVTGDERHSMLVEWNATERSYPDNACLHQLFEEQVERTPDAIALTFENTSLTYRELNYRANRAAHQLQAMGIGPDALVGVCMERSLEMVIALLATLKAGGAYVPLEPGYPPERLAYIIEDAQIATILTQTRFRDLLPHNETQVLSLDDEQFLTQSEMNPVSAATPEHLVYVIYTSGSTGHPKGVMNIHRALANRLHWMQQSYHLTNEDQVMQKTPFSFDVSVWEFFWPLLYGARLVVARPGGHQDASYLASLIQTQQITTMHFVPSMLRAFLAESGIERCTSLKRVICSGEALSYDLQEQFFAHFNAELHNLYGPTEAAIDVTAWQCQRENSDMVVPIGYPIANTQMYILNSALQPVPIGVAGELHIGGVGLARGYLNRPELTAEKFIADPFSTQPGARLFKTGDLARYREDGAIEFLGRIDHQVKIRGVRIELGEVEAALAQHPDVQEVVVVAREDTPGDARLVAYLATQNTIPLQVEELRGFLKKQLTQDMLPAAFVFLDHLPLLSNGKVNRSALPAPDTIRPELETTFIAPRNETEEQLVAIWSQVLNIDTIGVRDNFFDLGGHSLLAVRMIARVEQVCGKKLALTTLFAGPTVEQVAEALQRKQAVKRQTPLIPVQLGEATSKKRPFFFLHGDVTGGAFYCFAIARTLGKDQPFYVIEPDDFGTTKAPLPVEEMVKPYIHAIRAAQPEGPYSLGGFCNGALMAHEIAQQLHSQGQQVDLLLLIDPIDLPHHNRIHRLLHAIETRLHLSKEIRLDVFLRLRHLYMLASHKSIAEEVNQPGTSLFTQLFPSREMLRRDYAGMLAWITSQYTHRPFYAKHVTIIVSEEEQLSDAWLIQAKKGASVDVYNVPGSHITCRTEHLVTLADYVRQSLYTVRRNNEHVQHNPFSV